MLFYQWFVDRYRTIWHDRVIRPEKDVRDRAEQNRRDDGYAVSSDADDSPLWILQNTSVGRSA
jgi:hypothetical protein